jgi:excisionase family DNA binding protein
MSTIHTHTSQWVGLTDAGKEGPFSKRTLQTLIAQGRLAAYRPLNRKILIKRTDLDKIIESRRIGADLDRMVNEVAREMLGK